MSETPRGATPLLVACVGVALVAARAPFLPLGAVQDDAFITWRCARQLADTGVYGFNAGERLSASTSHAYVALVASLRALTGPHFLEATLGVNVVLTVAATGVLSRLLTRTPRAWIAAWALAALSPTALLISYSGMETPLVVFGLTLALALLRGRGADDRRSRHAGAYVALALLPWVRIDAAFLAFVAGAAQWPRDRRLATRAIGAAGLGLTSVLAWSRLYFGTFVSQSVVAKLDGLRASHTPTAVAYRVAGAFVGNGDGMSAFTPVATKYLAWTGPLFLVASWVAWRRGCRRHAAATASGATRRALGVIVFAPPAIYAASAVTYPWYVWPSLLVASVLIASEVTALEGGRRLVRAAQVGARSLVAAGVVAQWGVAFSAGLRERVYVESVGRFVRERASEADTLFVDSAGRIPFTTGLATDDDAGLVSARVTRAEETLGLAWLAPFLAAREPVWIVLRSPLEERLADATTPAERDAVLARYPLVRRFRYDPDALASAAPLRRLARLGTAYDYFVYRRALTTTRERPPPR